MMQWTMTPFLKKCSYLNNNYFMARSVDGRHCEILLHVYVKGGNQYRNVSFPVNSYLPCVLQKEVRVLAMFGQRETIQKIVDTFSPFLSLNTYRPNFELLVTM